VKINEKQIVLAAGGTGGHMFPAAALATEMLRRGWSIALITDVRGQRIAPDFPADPIHVVDAAAPSFKRPHTLPKSVISLWRGYREARALMAQLAPHIVMGFGGYPAFPALAAKPEWSKMILHEQNAVLGRVNRVFARKARAIASGFTTLAGLPSGAASVWTVTGNPVRADFLTMRDCQPSLLSPESPIRLVILGGSQGASVFSELVPSAIGALPESLRSRIEIVQQARPESVDAVRDAYAKLGVSAEVSPFFDDVPRRLAEAHLVLSRAGASSLTEIGVIGRPSILFPLPIAQDNHQVRNAEALVKAGAADIFDERQSHAGALAALLQQRLGDRHALFERALAARAIGRTEATRVLADLVEKVANSRGQR
jgi:UDP-N-acetylglucosamine--N-acetylmuramyl-(pentapeptide) pyrophosphoryl-undecaprenol N-acetylglucosamine transferase